MNDETGFDVLKNTCALTYPLSDNMSYNELILVHIDRGMNIEYVIPVAHWNSVCCSDAHILVKQMPHQQQTAVGVESPPAGRARASPAFRQQHVARAHGPGFERQPQPRSGGQATGPETHVPRLVDDRGRHTRVADREREEQVI